MSTQQRCYFWVSIFFRSLIGLKCQACTRHSGASTIFSITFLRLFLFEFYACLTREIQLKSHFSQLFFVLLFDWNHKYTSFNGRRWLKIYPSRITRNRLPFPIQSILVCLFSSSHLSKALLCLSPSHHHGSQRVLDAIFQICVVLYCCERLSHYLHRRCNLVSWNEKLLSTPR